MRHSLPFQGTFQGGFGDAFVAKLSVLIDSDGDSVPEDGDGSGIPGDNPCTGGATTNCDDNCPDVENPGQEDADSDGVGDICDNSPGDYNPGQEDADGDGEGDVSDDCTDTDGDGFGNPGFPANTCPDDNCPYAYNPGQEDSDSNGVGDVCDVGCCQVRGDIDHSGSEIDISDLVYLVDYMFNGGPEPPCFEEPDLDASGGIDIADLVYLVDYMFTGGPEPVACP